jgi:hypothetical protein
MLTRKTEEREKENCPSTTLSTINPTLIDPEANPVLRSERPATNSLSHGTAETGTYVSVLKIETILLSETLVLVCKTTRLHNPQNYSLNFSWPCERQMSVGGIFMNLCDVKFGIIAM